MARPEGSLGRADLRFNRVEIRRLELERNKQLVGALWLRGYHIRSIAEELQIDYADVLAAVKESRAEYRQWHQDELLSLAAERIESFRRIQQQAWVTLQLSPRYSAPLLALLQRCEENIAKIQGVLTERVTHLGRVDVNLKLYDFTDNLPPAMEAEVMGILADGRTTQATEEFQQVASQPTIVEGVTMPEAKESVKPKVFWKKNLRLEYPGLEETEVTVQKSPNLGNLQSLLDGLKTTGEHDDYQHPL